MKKYLARGILIIFGTVAAVLMIEMFRAMWDSNQTAFAVTVGLALAFILLSWAALNA